MSRAAAMAPASVAATASTVISLSIARGLSGAGRWKASAPLQATLPRRRPYHLGVTLPDILGLTMRAATRADIPAIAALIASCEIANDGVAEVHPSDIEQSFDLADEAGVIIVETPDRLVAWATVADGRAEADVIQRGAGVGSAPPCSPGPR